MNLIHPTLRCLRSMFRCVCHRHTGKHFPVMLASVASSCRCDRMLLMNSPKMRANVCPSESEIGEESAVHIHFCKVLPYNNFLDPNMSPRSRTNTQIVLSLHTHHSLDKCLIVIISMWNKRDQRPENTCVLSQSRPSTSPYSSSSSIFCVSPPPKPSPNPHPPILARGFSGSGSGLLRDKE